jgi:TP901 family phage tail tape measure protein
VALQIGELFVNIKANMSELKRNLDQARQDSERAGNAIGDALKKGFGFAAGMAGFQGLSSALHELAQSALDFGGTMQKVKVLSDATNEEMKQLTDTALKMAPAMGFKATEAAEGLQELAASGFTAQQMAVMLPAVMSAAAASGEKLSLASELVASQLHSFGMEASQAGHIADVLAKASNISAIGMQDLNYSLKYAGPVAHAVGVSFEELGAAIAVMGNNGIKGEQAGTTLRSSIESLINPSREARDTMAALGISVKDSQGNLLPLATILGTFQEKLQNATSAQKAQAVAMIFGKEAASGMLSLIAAGPDKLKEFTKELENSAGSSKKAAEEMNNNFGGSLKKLQGTIQAVAVDIEKTLDPILKSVTDSLNKMFSSLKNSDEFKTSLSQSASTIASVFKLVVENSDKVILAIKAISSAFVAMRVVAVLNIATIAKALETLKLLLLSTRGWVGIAAAAFVVLEDSAGKNLYGIGDKQRSLGEFFVQSWKLMVNNALIIWYGFCQLVNQTANGIFKVINGIGKAFGSAGDLINTKWIDEQKAHLEGLVQESDKLANSVGDAGAKVAEAFSSWKTPGDPNADFQSLDSASYNTKADQIAGLGDAFKGLGADASAAMPEVSGLGSLLDDIGQKSKKGAKDSREEWEKLSDALQSSLRVIQAQWQLTTIEMGANAEQTKKLEAELSSLNDQYYIQNQIVEEARQGYETMLATKGIAAKETAEAADAYAKESKTLADMKDRMDEINLTLAKHEEIVNKLRDDISNLNILHETQLAKLAATATKVDELRLKQKQLNEDLTKQADLIKALTTEYEAVKAAKGEDSNETRKAYTELIKAQSEEAKMRKELRDTDKSFKEQANNVKELRDKLTDLTTKYDEVIKKQKDDLADALSDYAKKVLETNKKLADDEKKLTDDFKKTLNDRAKSLSDFVGLFEAVQPKQVSGTQLLNNLKGQVDTFEGWQKNIQTLAAKGVDQGLIAELKEMGPKSASEVAALTTLTDTQLQQYVALWKQKTQDARTEATNQLQQQNAETQQKILDLRTQANTQLEEYRKEWAKKNEEIRSNTQKEINEINKSYKEITEKSKDYGVNMMLNFIDGAKSKFADLQKMLSETVDTISSYMSMVGISTPAINMPSVAKVGSSVSNSSSQTYTVNNLGGIQLQYGSSSDVVDQLLRELQKKGVKLQ